MAILMILDLPGGTTELYESINDELGIHTADDLPEGCIAHAAATTEDGMVVIDVWESPEAFERFAEHSLGPVARRRGMPEPRPRIVPVHNRIHAGRGANAGVMGIFETPLTPDQYDEMVARMPAHSDGGADHPAVSHTAGVQDGTILIVDLWESPEAFQAFQGQITNALAGDPPPMQVKFLPVHNHLRSSARVEAA